MVFYEASPPSILHLIQAIFKACFIISISIIFWPRRFFSEVMFFVLILGALSSQIKTNNNFVDTAYKRPRDCYKRDAVYKFG